MSSDVDPRVLLGTWSFTRTVEDRLARDVVEVAGTTVLAEEGTSIRWAEEGLMRRGDMELPVSRVLRLVPEADSWRVTFEDGRDFHPWQPGGEVVHLCGADTYRGVVEVAPTGTGESADEWSVIWRVTGPTKDYEMRTRLLRP